MTLAGCLSFIRDTPITANVLGLNRALRFTMVSLPYFKEYHQNLLYTYSMKYEMVREIQVYLDTAMVKKGQIILRRF